MNRRFRPLYYGFVAALALSAVVTNEARSRVIPSEAYGSGVTREVRKSADASPALGMTAPAPLIIPVRGITKADLKDTWGQSRGNGLRRHTAIDILAPRGTPALAAVDGTILKLFESRAGGLTLYLADVAGTTLYYYAHLDAYAANIREGMRVRQGDVVGYVGTTGNAPPGTPHLHFGIEQLPPSGEWWKGVPMNPYPILMQRAR